MPSFVVRRRIALLSLSFALAPASLAAQLAVGSDVNAAADTGKLRQPLFFPSAALARRGQLAISVEGLSTWQQVRLRETAFNGAGTQEAQAYTSAASLSWGATSWLTVGGYAARSQGEVSTRMAPPSIDSLSPVSRVSAGREENEIGVQARVGLWHSRQGGTRVTATGVISDRDDMGIGGAAGLALQQQLGRVTLHVAPTAWFFDNRSEMLRVDAGAALALARRTTFSTELMYGRILPPDGFRSVDATSVTVGVRQHYGRLSVHLGYLLGVQGLSRDMNHTSARLGVNWGF